MLFIRNAACWVAALIWWHCCRCDAFVLKSSGIGSRKNGIGSRNNCDASSTTSSSTKRRVFWRRHVSELHIPGYAETKLPFILSDNEISSIQEQRNSAMEFTAHDFHSLIPHETGYLLHKTKAPIFTAVECKGIVQEAEAVAARIEWTKNRHGNFPTTDIPIVELPTTMSFLKWALVERIYPALRAQFGMFLPDPHRLRVADGFIVKYDADGGQKELKPHRDGSVLSFNIALNPANDFQGGGTWFASLDQAIKIDQGEMVSHASGLLHGGQGITSGKRYILVAFVILEGYDSWSMRFYNQVRNK